MKKRDKVIMKSKTKFIHQNLEMEGTLYLSESALTFISTENKKLEIPLSYLGDIEVVVEDRFEPRRLRIYVTKKNLSLDFFIPDPDRWIHKIVDIRMKLPYTIDSQGEKKFEAFLRSFIGVQKDIFSKEEEISGQTPQEILIKVIKCPFCKRLIPEDSKICPYCKKDLEFRVKINKFLKEKQEYQKRLENLKKRKEELIQEGILSEEEYEKKYNEIMDKLVDIEDRIIRTKLREEKPKGGE